MASTAVPFFWTLSLLLGNLPLLAVAAESMPEPPHPIRQGPSLLTVATAVAERACVPRMRNETNLTWKEGQLAALARLFAIAGREARALELLTEARDLSAEGLSALIQVHLERAELAQAKPLLARLKQIDDWTASRELGRLSGVFAAAGEVGPANALARALPEAGDRLQALLELAKAGKASGGWTEAAVRAARALPEENHHIPGEHGEWEWISEPSPTQQGLVSVISVLANQGEVSSARALLGALDAASNGDAPFWKARALLAIGEHHAKQGAQAQAVQAWREASELLSSNSDSYPLDPVPGRVTLLTELGKRLAPHQDRARTLELLTEAERLAQKSEQERPEVSWHSELRVQCARVALAAGDLDRARRNVTLAQQQADLLAQVASGEPAPPMRQRDHVEALAHVAVGWAELGDNSASGATLTRAAAEAGKMKDATWSSIAWKALATVYAGAGRLEEVLDTVFLSAKVRNPRQAEAVDYLATTLLEKGQPQRALLLLALAQGPLEEARLAALISGPLARAGEPNRGAQLITHALTLLSGRPDGWEDALVSLALLVPGADKLSMGKDAALLKSLASPVLRRKDPPE